MVDGGVGVDGENPAGKMVPQTFTVKSRESPLVTFVPDSSRIIATGRALFA